MKGFSIFALSASLLSTCTEGIQLRRRAAGTARVVGLPFEKNTVRDTVPRGQLSRRASTAEAAVEIQEISYYTNIALGTPAQNLRVLLSTGASDFWVNADSSESCQKEAGPCDGVYSANDSLSYSFVSSDFKVEYVIGETEGDFATDKFTIGTATLPRLQFGIGYKTSPALEGGVLGLGYEISQVQAKEGRAAYNTLTSQMVENGLIQSNAYSLWMENPEINSGKILFGGVDTAKFTGTLQTLPIQTTRGRYEKLCIALTALAVGDTVFNNEPEPAVIDTALANTFLPYHMAHGIYNLIGAQYDFRFKVAFVGCALADDTMTLDFTFSGATISVPMKEMVFEIPEEDREILNLSESSGICYLGISVGNRVLLGDTFLRSAYLVFDLANNEISIAQNRVNPYESQIHEITTGTASVPNATHVKNPIAAPIH
ncbi:acid protease [Diplocarpon rosae]|nr:acid protease [Diplocarpon rosae]